MSKNKLLKIKSKKNVLYCSLLALGVSIFFLTYKFGFLNLAIRANYLFLKSGENAKFCNYLSDDIKFECYSKFISFSPGNDTDNMILLANLAKKNFRMRECHFLHHEVGIHFAQYMDVVSAMDTCKKFNQCINGCDHGVGQGLVIKYQYGLIGVWDKIQKQVNSYTELKKLMHGMGHYAFNLYRKKSASLNFCENITGGDDDYMGTCVAGASHENFFHSYPGLEFTDFVKEYKECGDYKKFEDMCRVFLAYGISSGSIWTGSNDLDAARKVLSFCTNLSGHSCYDGAAMGVDAIYNFKNQTMNNSETLDFCKDFFGSQNLSTTPCIRGILYTHFIFELSPNYAFETCQTIENLSERKICYSFLISLFGGKKFQNKVDFCSLVSRDKKLNCVTELRD